MKQKSDKPRGFVFFPQDYFGDVAVRMMPGYLRIVWVEAFLLMSDSPQRGVLLKANGQPYKIAELSVIMNLSVEHITEALEWVVREQISGVDRRTKQITNRKMIREEIKRKTASLNGKKGGNPALVKPSKKKDLKNQVNQTDILARAITDPEPDPEPDPVSFSNPVDDSLIESPPGAEKRAGQPDLAHDAFALEFKNRTGTAYVSKKADFIQLATLRKANGIQARASPEFWDTAIENYFASPLNHYTLGHLASKFATYRNSPTDRYGVPVNHKHAGGNIGRQHESPAAARAKRNADAKARVLAGLNAADGTGTPERSPTGSAGALPEGSRRP